MYITISFSPFKMDKNKLFNTNKVIVMPSKINTGYRLSRDKTKYDNFLENKTIKIDERIDVDMLIFSAVLNKELSDFLS